MRKFVSAPAKDKLYTDNYYMQMTENIRRYKGVRPIPENVGLNDFAADGDFSKYDLVVNKSVKSGSKTSVMKSNAHSRKWQAVGTANFSAAGSKLEICIPKKVLGLAVEKDSIVFDFKWCDNPQSLKDAISLCTDGDALA